MLEHTFNELRRTATALMEKIAGISLANSDYYIICSFPERLEEKQG